MVWEQKAAIEFAKQACKTLFKKKGTFAVSDFFDYKERVWKIKESGRAVHDAYARYTFWKNCYGGLPQRGEAMHLVKISYERGRVKRLGDERSVGAPKNVKRLNSNFQKRNVDITQERHADITGAGECSYFAKCTYDFLKPKRKRPSIAQVYTPGHNWVLLNATREELNPSNVNRATKHWVIVDTWAYAMGVKLDYCIAPYPGKDFISSKAVSVRLGVPGAYVDEAN